MSGNFGIKAVLSPDSSVSFLRLSLPPPPPSSDMDWRFFAISLVLLLWAEGGRAQLKCEDTTITEKKWACDGKEGEYVGDLNDECNRNEKVHVYCTSKAEFNGVEWNLINKTKLLGFPHIKTERNDQLCVEKFAKGATYVQATCNNKDCKVPMERILKECDVGYVKCSDKYLDLNEKMSVIKSTRKFTECALTLERKFDGGPWSEIIDNKTNRFIDNKTKRFPSDADNFVCLSVNNQMMVNAFCRNETTKEGDNCDVCAVRQPIPSTTEENTTPELGFFEKYNKYILGLVIFVLLAGIAAFAAYQYKKCKKTKETRGNGSSDNTKTPEYVGPLPYTDYQAMTPDVQRHERRKGKINRTAKDGSSIMGTPDNYGPVVTVTAAKKAKAAKKINC